MKHWMALLALLPTCAYAAAPLNMQMDVPTGGAAQQVVFVEHDFTKGESTGLHIHHGVEMTYVLKGTMRISIHGQAPFVAHAGDSFRVEREVPHEAVDIGGGAAALITTYVVDKDRPLKDPWPPQP